MGCTSGSRAPLRSLVPAVLMQCLVLLVRPPSGRGCCEPLPPALGGLGGVLSGAERCIPSRTDVSCLAPPPLGVVPSQQMPVERQPCCRVLTPVGVGRGVRREDETGGRLGLVVGPSALLEGASRSAEHSKGAPIGASRGRKPVGGRASPPYGQGQRGWAGHHGLTRTDDDHIVLWGLGGGAFCGGGPARPGVRITPLALRLGLGHPPTCLGLGGMS